MTPRLLLNSTKPKDYARNAREERCEVCGVCVCVLISTPLVFIAGSHGWDYYNQLQQPVERRHVAKLRRWGQPTPASSSRLSWASLSGPRWSWPVLACLNLVLASLLVHLRLNRCSDNFCDFMSGQSVLVTCILAWKHNLHILKGKLWFRDFIG